MVLLLYDPLTMYRQHHLVAENLGSYFWVYDHKIPLKAFI